MASQRELAAHFGVQRATIQNALQAGMEQDMRLAERWALKHRRHWPWCAEQDPEAQPYVDSTSSSRQARRKESETVDGADPWWNYVPRDDLPSQYDDAVMRGMPYDAAKRREEVRKLELANRKEADAIEIQRGALVTRTDVLAKLATMREMIQSEVRSLPKTVAARMDGKASVKAEVADIIEEELLAALDRAEAAARAARSDA